MNTAPLVDLSPLARLMLMGIVVALGPLLWIGLRHRSASTAARQRALTLLTLFLTFDLILFGAFTRLTDSGLGCPDWPGCYGQASPLGAHGDISAAQSAQPTGPVTHAKAWIEMVHRYLATGVGVLIVTLTVVAWREWVRQRRAGTTGPVSRPVWPTVTLVWVCLQGAFGALTVTMKLFPAIVTLHLLGGLGLLALLAVQAARLQAGPAWQPLPPGLRAALWATFGLVVLQAALGGWVSTNYAVLACSDFPRCQGQWWPSMDLRAGFELWRPLGHRANGQVLPFAALTAIHYVHRLMAYGVLLALGLLAWALHRRALLAGTARALALLAVWQLASGLSNVVLGWPLLAAVAHTGGAAALVLTLTWALAATRPARVSGAPLPLPASRLTA